MPNDKTVPFDALKLRAVAVAAQRGISTQEATRQLVHEIGHENVDFVGDYVTANREDPVPAPQQ